MEKLEAYVRESILNYFGHVVTSVAHIELLDTYEFNQRNRELLSAVLKTGNYHRVSELMPVKDLLGEDLTLFEFTDEDGKAYCGYYYDSIALEQDPEVMEIAPALPGNAS